jgi:RNA polymerase sigma factor (sigma-70 family)
MTYDDTRAMYTAYIERVAGFARKEYLRTLHYQEKEIPLEEQSEDTLALVEDRYFPGEFDLAEGRVSRAMNDLPLLRQQVLLLAFIEKLPAQEISERLGCSVSYVYKQKCLALRKLKGTREDENRGQ